jgi:hypothetical protein
MAMSRNSPEIYWKLWVKTWNILEKKPPWGVRTLTSYLFSEGQETGAIAPAPKKAHKKI